MTLRALAFSPHPDDVELRCGGTLIKLTARGYTVGVIDLSAGEMATRGSAGEREKESGEAGKILSLHFRENLGIPDGNIGLTQENKLKVIKAIRRHRPQMVMLPFWEDRHPDHAHASRLIFDAAYLSGLSKLDSGQEAFRPHILVYYMGYFEFTPSFVVDVSLEHKSKMKAIRAYRSQFYNPDYEAEETMLSKPEFLEDLESRSRYYGSLIGARYGEPFLLRGGVELDTPMSLLKG